MNQPWIEYDQRLQFFGTVGGSLNATNIINVHVITLDNIFKNTKHFNDSTQTFNMTMPANRLFYNRSLYNISASRINNTNISYNTGTAFDHSGYLRATLNWVNTTNTVVNESKIVFSNLYNSTIANSQIALSSIINDSNLTNAVIYNSQLVSDVIIINSSVNDSILQNVSIIDSPHTVYNSTVLNSQVSNVTINNSQVYNSTIDLCNMTFITQGASRGNVTVWNVNLTGNSTEYNGCILNGTVANYASATVIIAQEAHNFTYTVASNPSVSPLLKDIWNYTPEVTIVDKFGNDLNTTKRLTGTYMPLVVNITDPGLSNTLLDYVNISWLYADGQNKYHNKTALRGNNLSQANTNSTIDDNTTVDLTLNVTDKFGNTVIVTITDINYTVGNDYDGDGIDDDNDNCPTIAN
jgi:hypothetical protein